MGESTIYKQLEGEVRARYRQKISLINNTDPYCLKFKKGESNLRELPNVHYFDVIEYLKTARSPYTQNELKAIKSTKAYIAFSCGWVKDVNLQTFDENVLIAGRVLHSQRLNEPALKPWIICKKEGTILCAHCDCVAGLGEACSHVGALLFAVEHTVRTSDPASVTGVKSTWVVPAQVGKQEKLVKIDLTTGKRKYSCLNEPLEELEEAVPIRNISEPTQEQKLVFLANISSLPYWPGVLNVMDPYCHQIQEERKQLQLQFITALYDPELEQESLETLVEIGQEVDFSMSKQQCQFIEENTRKQNKSKLWHQHRAGRVTASVFKRVCSTKIENPSVSLVKQICYPQQCIFKSAATAYGCTHEAVALPYYKNIMNMHHTNIEIKKVGLIVSTEYPHFGASPDGILKCSCHGERCIEIKCPFCIKDSSVEVLLGKKNMCLKLDEGTIKLDKNHPYYYQMQMQLAITNNQLCDFVIWSPQNIYVETIVFDEQFWEEKSKIALLFHKNVIMPEILGKYFTTKTVTLDASGNAGPLSTETVINEKQTSTSLVEEEQCLCRKPAGKRMIRCTSTDCTIQWFHYKCVSLKKKPNINWCCAFCTKKM